LEIARATGLPLSTLEIGASAGLNLNWDHFRYSFAGRGWGDAASAVHLKPEWKGSLPPLDTRISVIARAACDVAPVDIAKEENRALLKSYVWPDQPERLARLEGALAIAVANGTHVEKADALEWLTRKLEEPQGKAARVIYHSIMWQYM